MKLDHRRYPEPSPAPESDQGPQLVQNPTSTSAHICFVLPAPERYTPTSGGAIATVTHQLARSLVRDGHRITVLTPDDGEPRYGSARVMPLRFGPAVNRRTLMHKALVLETRLRGLAWPEYGQYLREVRRSVRALEPQPDLVIVANDPELALRLHRWGVGRRQVLWLHNRLEGREARRLGDLPAEIGLVAVSDSVRSWTAATYDIEAESIRVVHNGIDSEEFCPRADYLAPRWPIRVVSHGRIDPNKGHEVAARAVASLRRQGIPVTFTLVGGVQTFGISEAETRRYASEVDGAVSEAGGTAMGRVPAEAVAGILADHDVACVLSQSSEPFSLAALEAMASGCAVVTTALGGIAEVVGDVAVRVDPGASEEVAEAIATFVTHPDWLADRKAAGRRRSEEFTWDQAAGVVAEMATRAGGTGS